MRLAVIALVLFSAGCGRYAEFTLPPPQAGPEPHYRWEVRAQPVLERGATGEWDASDVLNPSVMRLADKLLNLYSGFDGHAWHTGLAESADGITWTRRGKVLSPDPATWEGKYIAANGSALIVGGEILYWYQAGNPPRIGLAGSPNATKWTKEPKPVLDVGPVGSWDERGIGDPYVIRADDSLYLFYTGIDRASRQRLGVARSSDGGKTWTKLRSNPIFDIGPDLAFDENGLGEPAVWTAGGSWWMLYTGRDRHEFRRIGLAQSKDGIHWKRSSDVPVFAGDQPWNDKVVCDPTVEVTPGAIRVWFGGGNVASPDERLNGAIGYAELKPAQ